MSLGTLVLSLADNKQLLGLRYAEWATRAPSLEADIAAAAMGLDDLGHSRVLLGCLEPLGEDPRGSERETDPAAYRNVPMLDQPWTEWNQFVAANAILDTAFTVLIESMVEGSVEVLRTRLRKMLLEERYHFLHGRSWFRAGGAGGSGGAGEATIEAWQQARVFFGPPEGDVDDLHRLGRLSIDSNGLMRRLSERLEVPEPSLEIDWSAWDPERRRTAPGAIDERTFAMIRGLEEKKFAPARPA